MYAFDVAYEMTRQPVEFLLGQKAEPYIFGPSKRSPRHVFFYKPQMVRLPEIERVGPYGPVKLERVVKVLPELLVTSPVKVGFGTACGVHCVPSQLSTWPLDGAADAIGCP